MCMYICYECLCVCECVNKQSILIYPQVDLVCGLTMAGYNDILTISEYKELN